MPKTTQTQACTAILDAFRPMTAEQRADDPDANWHEQLTVAERIQDDAEDGKVCIADVNRLAELVTNLHDHIAADVKRLAEMCASTAIASATTTTRRQS